jgi:hypothetical protein
MLILLMYVLLTYQTVVKVFLLETCMLQVQEAKNLGIEGEVKPKINRIS